MNLADLLARLRRAEADFEDVIAYVNAHYTYTPARFTNGSGPDPVVNEAGRNEGSCRVFALARLHGLSVEDTVQLFGRFYREDVLRHPEADDHANIRRFLKDGWAGISFDTEPLAPRQAPAAAD